MIHAMHNLAVAHCNLLTSIQIAKDTGYAAVEIGGPRLKRYLAQGYAVESLRPLLDEIPPSSLTYIQDSERQEPKQYEALLAECEELCALAESIGCPYIQVLTGPLDPNGPYKGLGDKPWPEQRRLAAKNLKALAAIGKQHKVKFFLEGLAFTSVNRLDQQIEIIEETACDNVGLVLDFYHLWGGGTRAEEIAKMNKNYIFHVDFCDSSDAFGGGGDAQQRGRDVWTGGGRIPLKEWVDAVRATGYDGIWKCELLSPKYWELDPRKTAADLKTFLEYMLV